MSKDLKGNQFTLHPYHLPTLHTLCSIEALSSEKARAKTLSPPLTLDSICQEETLTQRLDTQLSSQVDCIYFLILGDILSSPVFLSYRAKPH
jgi:hypothetical protein